MVGVVEAERDDRCRPRTAPARPPSASATTRPSARRSVPGAAPGVASCSAPAKATRARFIARPAPRRSDAGLEPAEAVDLDRQRRAGARPAASRAATPASSRSPGARVMNSLMSLTRRADAAERAAGAGGMHRPAVHQDADAERIGVGDVGAGETFGPIGAGAVARLEADRRAEVGVVRQAAVGDDHVAGHEVQRLALADSAGGSADDDAERGADLELAGRVVDAQRRAGRDQGVARLDVEHRRLRRRLVGRLVGGLAERCQRIAVIHQDAVDRARQAIRRELEGQVEGRGHRQPDPLAQGRGETPNSQRCAQKTVSA